MPQVIESDVRQSGFFQDGLKVFVDEAVHNDGPSDFRNKDQVYRLWPFLGINNWTALRLQPSTITNIRVRRYFPVCGSRTMGPVP